jgi:hypothetical protein
MNYTKINFIKIECFLPIQILFVYEEKTEKTKC